MNTNQHDPNMPALLGGRSGQMTVRDPYANVSIPESELSFQDVWKVITQHKGMILAVFFIVLITTIIATLLLHPIYRAHSSIYISTGSNKMKTETIAQREYTGQYSLTQQSIVLSRSVAEAVINKMSLQNVPEINGSLSQRGFVSGAKNIIKSIVLKDDSGKSLEIRKDNSVGHVARFRQRLAISRAGKSDLFRVTFDSFDPKLAADVVNTTVSEYIRLDRVRRLSLTSEAKTFLESEITAVQAKLESSERNLIDFARKNSIIDLEVRDNTVVQRLSELNNELTRITSQKVAAEASWNQASLGTGLEALPVVLNNSFINRLKDTQFRLQSKYSKLSKIYKSEYPELKQLKAQLDETNESINKEIRRIVEGIKNTYERLLNGELLITEQIEQQKQTQLDLKDKSVQYNILKRAWESNKELYTVLLKSVQEISVSGGMQPNNITVIDAAIPPQNPYKPNLLVNVLLASMLGLFGGVIVAIVLAFLDNTVTTPDDLEKVVGLASLGMVPIEKNKQKRKKKKNALDNENDVAVRHKSMLEFRSYVDRKNHLSEAFRSIRTSLMFSSSAGFPKIIQVTSTMPGEGKTTLACNLALVLADTDTDIKVLLMDADLRRHKLHKVFDMPLSPGLSEAIISKEDKDFARDTAIKNLYVLPAGTTPANPAELVGSKKMSDFMQRIAENYDYVVIDSPPLLGLADAVVLSTKVDGVVYTVHSGSVNKDELFEGVKRLRRVHAPLVGAILNQVDLSKEEYIFYGGYYYAYSDSDK